MERAEGDGAEDEQIESAGKQLSLVVQENTPNVIRRVAPSLLSCQGERVLRTAYSHGLMRTQNRVGLVDAACERYQVVNDEYIRLGLL